MRRLEVAAEAERDIDALLSYSEDRFGSRIADRYRLLIDTAFTDLCARPDRPMTKPTPDRPDLRRYHLRFSARHLPRVDRIASPRHIVVFRFDDSRVEILRVLYDGMDLPGRLKPAD